MTNKSLRLRINSLFFFRYSVCIRQEEGYCCVQYMLCSENPNRSFGIDNNAAGAALALQDACSQDYIGIAGKNMHTQ